MDKNQQSTFYSIIVAGTRDFNNYSLLRSHVMAFINEEGLDLSKVCIVSGGATGADELGEEFSREVGTWLKMFPANWEKYGKSAGPRRNEEMAKYADACIVFWDGRSRGTKNMIDNAHKHGLDYRVVYYNKEEGNNE